MKKVIKYFLSGSITITSALGITSKVNAQVKSLFINSYDNIVKVNSTAALPKISYTGLSNGFEAIAHTEDNTGNTLFFINANGVYNSKGELMPGSRDIYANPSTAEINICPFPGNSKKYYIIYNAELCSELYYSIVDLNLNKGSGDVTHVNTVLDTAKTAEGIELIKRPCRNSYWLIAYACETGFKKYLITETGISAGTLIEPYVGPPIFLGRGELDYHNGKMGLSFANSPEPVTFLCNFDADSGKITNLKTVHLPDGGNGVYGLEFSPDATKAYMTEWYENKKDNLFQYNFETDSLTSFYITSTPAKAAPAITGPGQIELGANEKLYIPFDGGNQITVINNPNSEKPTFSKITTTSVLALGISDHIQSDLLKPANNFTFEHVCIGETTEFYFQPSVCTDSKTELLWDFGDPESKKKNTSVDFSPSHTFKKAGAYKVTLYIIDSKGRDTVSHRVTISTPPKVNLGKDTAICPGDSLILRAGNNNMDYKWSNGDFKEWTKVAKPGKYTVTVSHIGCSASDAISIKFNPKPIVDLGDDMWLCDETEKILDGGTKSNSYIWSTGEQTPKIKVKTTGSYTVKASNGFCTSYDTVDLVFQKSPVVKLGNDTILCSKRNIELNAGTDGDSYFWSTGTTNQAIKVTSTGTYYVTVGKGTCLTKDTIQIIIKEEIPVITVPQKFILNPKEPFFKIYTANIKDFHIQIYSDNNTLIYESTDPSKSWRVRSETKQAEPGAYTYIIEYTTRCNKIIQKKQGSFVLSEEN